MTDKRNYSLLQHNTFGIDASCRRYVECSSVDEVQGFVRSLSADDEPLLMLGGGSNLLLTRDYPATVIHSGIMGMEILPEPTNDTSSRLVRCGSGEVWDDVVSFCIANGLYDAENLSIIPGEVGASAIQNIGAYGVEAKDLIVEVEAVEIATGNIQTFTNAECEYGYRQSKFKHEWLGKFFVTHVTYRLSTIFRPHLDYGNIRSALAERGINEPTASELRQTIIDIREAKLPDPKVEGNAGSFFMNPIVDAATFKALKEKFDDLHYFELPSDNDKEPTYKIPAGWMIDRCGWKGKSLGRAGVHDKQALVLVNRGGASGHDIIRLMEAVQKDVKEKFGIEIHPEVNIR